MRSQEPTKPFSRGTCFLCFIYLFIFVKKEWKRLTQMITYWSLWSSYTSGSLLDGGHDWWVIVMGVFINWHWMCLLLEAKKKNRICLLGMCEGTSMVPRAIETFIPRTDVVRHGSSWHKLSHILGVMTPVFTVSSARWRWWGRECGSRSSILQWWFSCFFLGIVLSHTWRGPMSTWSFPGTANSTQPNTPYNCDSGRNIHVLETIPKCIC